MGIQLSDRTVKSYSCKEAYKVGGRAFFNLRGEENSLQKTFLVRREGERTT